jgi:hypothetical protein
VRLDRCVSRVAFTPPGLSLRVWTSSRVSIPMTSRLMGSAPTVLTFHPRGLASTVSSSGWCHDEVPPSSHALVVRVRNLSAAILSPARPRSPLRSTSAATVPEGPAMPKHASVSALPEATSGLQRVRRPSPGVIAETVPLPGRWRDLCGLTPPTGPYDACQPAFARPRCDLAATPSTGRVCLSRLVSRRGSASLVSCWFVPGHPYLQRFLPILAARPSRAALSSLPFVALRRRGSEDFSHPAVATPELAWQARRPGDLLHLAVQRLAADGCVRRRRRCSRLRQVAPLLVVIPLRG